MCARESTEENNTNVKKLCADIECNLVSCHYFTSFLRLAFIWEKIGKHAAGGLQYEDNKTFF